MLIYFKNKFFTSIFYSVTDRNQFKTFGNIFVNYNDTLMLWNKIYIHRQMLSSNVFTISKTPLLLSYLFYVTLCGCLSKCGFIKNFVSFIMSRSFLMILNVMIYFYLISCRCSKEADLNETSWANRSPISDLIWSFNPGEWVILIHDYNSILWRIVYQFALTHLVF